MKITNCEIIITTTTPESLCETFARAYDNWYAGELQCLLCPSVDSPDFMDIDHECRKCVFNMDLPELEAQWQKQQ